ncbi:MAG: GNAT family N-acetyltransferase [Candidatus Aminicenantes bacterium]|nr:GNAT family N-acetyltransferase [Candidatus Aminicenantes bacterium]
MIIREATPRDNEALLNLSRQTPMESGLSVFVDRSPDYFYLASLQGKDSKVIVAERKGEIIGTMGFCYRNVRLFGKNVRAAYIGGLKITESGRRTTALYRIIRRVYKELIENGVDVGIGLFIEGNEKAKRVFEKGHIFPIFHPVANIKIFHIIPLWGKRRTKYKVERATMKDFYELAELFSKHYSKYELIENFNTERVKRILRESKNFSIDNFLIIREKGKIVTSLSYWDQMEFKRTVVRRYGRTSKILYYALKPFNVFPPPGEPLKLIEIRHLVYEDGCLDAIKGLVSYFLNRIWPEYKIVKVGINYRDPLIEAFRGLPKVALDVVFNVATAEENLDLIKKLRNSLVWEDMTLH